MSVSDRAQKSPMVRTPSFSRTANIGPFDVGDVTRSTISAKESIQSVAAG